MLGAIFVDIKGYPAAAYIPGGRNMGYIEQVHGGVSRNVAEDIANVELRPRFISVVDHSALGREVIDRLNAHKVDTRFIRRVEDGMGTWLAVFNNNGDVEAAISKRPDLSEIGRILDEQGNEIFRDADSVLLEIDMEREQVKKVLYYAGKYHIPVYAAVSNMSIAVQWRDQLQAVDCILCNRQEAGILFSEDYERLSVEEMRRRMAERVKGANIRAMIITLGEKGAVFADREGNSGWCPAQKVAVKDTTGAGDAFFAGCAIGLTYGKSMMEACRIGTRLAASVITVTENVCPRFRPEEFGITPPEME